MTVVQKVYPDFKREIKINRQFLHFPVKHGGTKRVLRIFRNNEMVREFTIEYAKVDDIDYWVFLNVDDFTGDKLTMQIPHLRDEDNLA